jgi:hypothetical protein
MIGFTIGLVLSAFGLLVLAPIIGTYVTLRARKNLNVEEQQIEFAQHCARIQRARRHGDVIHYEKMIGDIERRAMAGVVDETANWEFLAVDSFVEHSEPWN